MTDYFADAQGRFLVSRATSAGFRSVALSDITTQRVDAIVNAANDRMRGGGGVSDARSTVPGRGAG